MVNVPQRLRIFSRLLSVKVFGEVVQLEEVSLVVALRVHSHSCHIHSQEAEKDECLCSSILVL